MVDDRPAPPLVGSQQAPVVADVFPERGELDSIVQRASIPHPRGAAGCIKGSGHRSPFPQRKKIMQSPGSMEKVEVYPRADLCRKASRLNDRVEWVAYLAAAGRGQLGKHSDSYPIIQVWE